MNILLDFLTDQVFNFIFTRATDKARSIYAKRLLRDRMLQINQKFRDTVIDSDCFFTFYKYNKVSDSLWDFWHNPGAVYMVEEDFIVHLAGEFDTYCVDSGLQPAGVIERNCIIDFLQQVMDIFHQQALQTVSVEHKIATAINAQNGEKLKKELLNDFDRLLSDRQGKGLKHQSTAIPFQNKFHKKLFLEDANGPTLAQVYIWPYCQIVLENTISESFLWTAIAKSHIHLEIVESEGQNLSNIVSVSDAVEDFLEMNDSALLVIEGVAGSGKSSLMCALSMIYDDDDCYYLSMKDLIDRTGREHRTDFKTKLWSYFGLNGTDYGKILFLDGYDELHPHLDTVVFRDEIQSLLDMNYKIIMTTRPGYLEKDFMTEHCQMLRLQLFSDKQVEQWLNNYRIFNKSLSDETVAALINITAKEKLDEVRRIPIMLYVIANRNINVNTVTCMGDLYTRVFDKLKRDKAGETKQMLDRHYLIAQKMAYLMTLKNDLRIEAAKVREWCGDLFEESFFSSVYIENSIIEGTEMLEFVHKTILEFFAAKWIYKSLWEDDVTLQTVLAKADMTDEILAYIQYFYQKDIGHKRQFDTKIENAFETFLENGIIMPLPKINLKLTHYYSREIFHNIGLIIKYVMNKHLLSEELVRACHLELEQLLSSYYLNDLYKSGQGKSFLDGENFTGIKDIVGLNWSYEDLSQTVFAGTVFRRVDLKYSQFAHAHLRDSVFENCDLTHTSFDKAVLEQVIFDQASMINAAFVGAKLYDARFPRESAVCNIQFDWSEIASTQFFMSELNRCGFDNASLDNVSFYNMRMYKTTFDHAKLKDVTFERVTFVQCDFSGAEIDGTCRFIDCKFSRTKRVNSQFFTGDDSHWCRILSDEKS